MSPIVRYESLLTMSSKKYKNIYINGCSFTAGDNIVDGLTWPELLSKKLNLKLINQSVNGNSMQSITLNSVNHLSKLSSKDTLVIIGLTWEPRYMVQIGKNLFNITPAMFDNRNLSVMYGTWRRLSSPYSTNQKDLDNHHFKINQTNYNIVLGKFIDFYKSLVKYDDNLKNNQTLNLTTQIILLQSFLKQNNFDYKFINFGSINDKKVDLIDSSNVINLNGELYQKNTTSHPNEEQCVEISEEIYDIINS